LNRDGHPKANPLGLGLLHFYLDIERAGLSRRNSLDRRKDFEDKIAQQQKRWLTR